VLCQVIAVNLGTVYLISLTMVSLWYIILVGECNLLCYYTDLRFGNYKVFFRTGASSNFLLYPYSVHFCSITRLCKWLN